MRKILRAAAGYNRILHSSIGKLEKFNPTGALVHQKIMIRAQKTNSTTCCSQNPAYTTPVSNQRQLCSLYQELKVNHGWHCFISSVLLASV